MTVVDGESTEEIADRVEFCGYKPPPDFVSSTRNLHIMLKQELQPHGKGKSSIERQKNYDKNRSQNYVRF